jgi:RNA polymerase I-specific transcription initiation factor RRN3
VCSPNVAGQFARVAHTVHFLYCHSLLEANRRAEFGGVPLHAELTAFFPFDPYHLPRSAPYIRGVYRDWASVAIGGEDDDDDDDDEEEEDDEEGGEEMEDEAGRELGTSFGGMSISPMRPAVLV